METKTPSLLVTVGPLGGRRFSVSESGIRLGRSSSCEISIEDPALSRNQCLFELRDGKLWITDLASANGTAVNDEELGTSSYELKPGDRITAGDNELVVVGGDEDEFKVASKVEPQGDGQVGGDVDLGLSSGGDGADGQSASRQKGSPMRLVLWLLLVAVLRRSYGRCHTRRWRLRPRAFADMQ